MKCPKCQSQRAYEVESGIDWDYDDAGERKVIEWSTCWCPDCGYEFAGDEEYHDWENEHE